MSGWDCANGCREGNDGTVGKWMRLGKGLQGGG